MNTIDPNSPAFPQLANNPIMGVTQSGHGLSIRALIAKDLMAGMLANPNIASLVGMMSSNPPKDFAAAIIEQSISATDALITRLNK